MTPATDGHAVAKPAVAYPRKAFGAAILAMVACALSFGCGFTGGSVPVGRTLVFGRVVAAENPLIPLPNAKVMIQATPLNGQMQTLQVTTDANGQFSLNSVPTGAATGRAVVIVQPADPNSRQSQQVSFQTQNGSADNLVMTLPQMSFNVVQGTSVTISPPVATLPPQDSVQIKAQVHDRNGAVLPVVPSLLVNGAVGTISGDGTFYGTNTGSGTVTAFWYNNVSATAQVVVDSSVPPTPPPPPVLPQSYDTSGTQ